MKIIEQPQSKECYATYFLAPMDINLLLFCIYSIIQSIDEQKGINTQIVYYCKVTY